MGKFLTTLYAIAAIITILWFVNEFFYQFLPFQIFPDKQNQTTISGEVIQNQTIPPFDFESISFKDFNPVRTFFYNGSNNIVYYNFNNPFDETLENFTLIGEWFLHNDKEPLPEPYKENLTYNKVFEKGRFNWKVISSDSLDKNIVKFRVVLTQSGKNPLIKEVNYSLKFNDTLLPFLVSEEHGEVKLDDSVIREFINQSNFYGLREEVSLVRNLLKFTRKWMKVPAETKDIFYYDNEILDSISAWNNKTGTSSEYSVVYAMLLRIVGIPSKIEINPFDEDYYYVKFYSEENGWVPVDVYGKYDNFGTCFQIDALKRERVLKDICINSLQEYVEFEEIRTLNYSNTPGFQWAKIEGSMKNVWKKPLKSFCIKVDIVFYDKNDNVISTKSERFLSPANGEDLDVEGKSEFFSYIFTDVVDYDHLKIELNSFSQLCE
ncbi:MAG: transglutaminase-like domain-containing protein [archaeon]